MPIGRGLASRPTTLPSRNQRQRADSAPLANARGSFGLAEQKIGHGQYGKASMRSSRNSGRISGSFFRRLWLV
ncbi:MAG TPA: hypothetical protein VH369_02765, partial [Bryobacteraceae bacterium]